MTTTLWRVQRTSQSICFFFFCFFFSIRKKWNFLFLFLSTLAGNKKKVNKPLVQSTFQFISQKIYFLGKHCVCVRMCIENDVCLIWLVVWKCFCFINCNFERTIFFRFRFRLWFCCSFNQIQAEFTKEMIIILSQQITLCV